MLTNLGLFLSSLFIVFMLGLQSKNVNGNHYLLAAFTSTCIGLCNFFIIKSISVHQLDLMGFIAYVAGGPIGIVLSMWVHTRFVKPKR